MRNVLILVLLSTAAFAQALPDSPSFAERRFLDKPNLFLLGSLTLWQGIDAYRTDHTLDEGGREMFPIARQFCQTRESRIGYFWASYAATVGSSYLLNRRGHRKLARMALIFGNLSAASGVVYTLAHAS